MRTVGVVWVSLVLLLGGVPLQAQDGEISESGEMASRTQWAHAFTIDRWSSFEDFRESLFALGYQMTTNHISGVGVELAISTPPAALGGTLYLFPQVGVTLGGFRTDPDDIRFFGRAGINAFILDGRDDPDTVTLGAYAGVGAIFPSSKLGPSLRLNATLNAYEGGVMFSTGIGLSSR